MAVMMVMMLPCGLRQRGDDLGAARIAGAEVERGTAGYWGRHMALRHNRPRNHVGQQRQDNQGALWRCCIAAMCGET